ncbi:MAG: phosphoribosylformylglycinamidine cyclo-ligase [Ancrocorticia sp.]|uniref:phosphoribosylformylglycinamidine cyclo-ligase n=1 Tax=Ancrocorticia sp. TaxID=2593684 RepID=UPI003F8DF435
MTNAYAAAGVDTQAGDRAVELMRAAVARTMTPDVAGGVGGFAGMVDVSALKEYRKPLLATSTDGVGTKVAIAQAMDIHDTIGQDLVAMVVDDIVVVGATPLLMTDYIACGKVVPERIAAIVRGIAEACEYVGVPLLGGETAEHPGLMGEVEYDVAGAATGVVEADSVLGADRVQSGDVLIAMASSGLHSNGYSLVRKIVADAGIGLEDYVPELGRTLGEELLEPTALYTTACLALAEATDVHAYSHVTGGGLAANLARVIPEGLQARVDRSLIRVPATFQVFASLGRAAWEDMEDTLNLGVGMIAVVPADSVGRALASCQESGVRAWEIGDVVAGGAKAGLTSSPAGTRVATRLVSGTKGVSAGVVRMSGDYAL